MSQTIDINPKHHKIISDILYEYMPEREIIAFGSRAKWVAKDKSDLDLCIMGEEPISIKSLSALTDAVAESPIPFKVDFVEWAKLEDKFKEIVKRDGVKFGWPEFKIIDLGSVQTGPFGSQLHQKDYVSIGTPIITVEHLGDNRILKNNLPLVSEQDKKRLSKYSLQEGDIVFSRVGSVDRRAYVHKEEDGWLFSGRCLRVRVDKNKIDPYYLSTYFGLPSFKEYIRSIAVGATMPSLNTSILENISIILPPKKHQELIGDIAKSIEDRIELNRKMNETLEETAKALFKSWFVDFDPVKVKNKGEKLDGMDAATAELFPATFSAGSPEGWKKTIFEKCFNFTMGQSPPGETYNEIQEGIAFYQGRRDFGFRYPENRVYCTEPTRYANAGDTLLSVRAPVGDLNMAAEYCCIGRGLAAIRHKLNGRSFTYYAMLNMYPMFDAYNSEGTVFGSVNKTSLGNIIWLEPPSNIIKAFEDIIVGIDEKIESNTNQNHTLVALRDALLPKLISGNIKINETKNTIKEAV